MPMGESPTAEDDWCVECSDDEKYNPSKGDKGTWEPDPEDIKSLYERLSKGENLTLEWKCHGRRSPTPERQQEDMDSSSMKEEEVKPEEKTLPTEFDFDDFGGTAVNPITPRHTPGSSKTPRSTKRVARMDKIMDNMRRHKKLNEEVEKAATPSRPRTPGGSPGSTPSRPRTPGGSPGSTPSRPRTPGGSPGSTPQRPGSKGSMSPKKIS